MTDDRTEAGPGDDRALLDHMAGLWVGRSAERQTPAVLVVGFDDQELLIGFARPERLSDDQTDPVSEAGALATAAMATRRVELAALLLPTRMRLLDDPDSVSTALCLTTLRRAAPGWSMRATATAHEVLDGRTLLSPVTQELDLDSSPVASLLWDTMATSPPGPLPASIQAARIAGFDVAWTAEPEDLRLASATVDRTRARFRRVARELRQRHAPMAPYDVGLRVRSSVPVGLPSGMTPACPL